MVNYPKILKIYVKNAFSVNSVDSTRMDLVIPGEQHMYLKAATSQERQQWLVALGSAKACVHSLNGIAEPSKSH